MLFRSRRVIAAAVAALGLGIGSAVVASSSASAAPAAAALAPGGTAFIVAHDLTNLSEGTGGPQDPEVLYTPEAVRAELPGLRILRAERVRRTVVREDGEATAVDTLVRAVREI